MSEKDEALQFGPVGQRAIHLCVDMQKLFADDTPWHTPWMHRILPRVRRIAAAHAGETVFTRFVPAEHVEAAPGAWRRYYDHWSAVTLQALPPGAVDLIPSLAELTPPAEVFDKTTYGPWLDGRLHARLGERGIDTVIVTGGETDVCVLAAVIGAVDLGYRTIVVLDALCSGSDEGHDATMAIYRRRYGQQIEIVPTDVLLEDWR